MDISVIRHAVRAADRALSIAAKALRFLGWKDRQPGDIPPFPFAASEELWLWLTKPDPHYPQPPWPDDRNCRGIGWSGGERTRPFAPPAPLPSGSVIDSGIQNLTFAQPTVHENIQHPTPRRHLRTWDEP